jgi:hypothetical protein
MKDSNGNEVALVVGGPDDGRAIFIRDFTEGDTYTPAKTANNRPVYKLINGQFIFQGFEDQCIDCVGRNCPFCYGTGTVSIYS